MTTQQAKQVWEAVLGELQLQVTRPSYETWLKETVGIACNADEFIVGTPNTFVAEMLEQRMYSLISQAMERVTKSSVEVRFQVLPKDEALNGIDTHLPESMDANIAPMPMESAGQSNTGQSMPSAYRPISLNPKYTFETFIVGKSNELAHAAALAVAEKPGVVYNPLVMYSGVGLGKTHLLHAIGRRVQSMGMSLIYATTEDFTNEYIKAIREGRTEDFRNFYRSADLLLLDDIQFLIGKEQTQEGFFHTFNALHMTNRQIVITSDRPVAALTLLEDRIRSRLEGGLVVDIQPPDLETRLAILRAKADLMGLKVDSQVLELLAERVHKNIRELEGNLNRVVAYAQLTNSDITPELVKRAVADLTDAGRDRQVSDEVVLDAVSSYYRLDKETLKGRKRDKKTALARQVAMYLLREDANLGSTAIGRILGGKDHTTVLHGCKTIENQQNVDSQLRREIISIRETLANS
ncbi:MAG: chromosomal replication initiator protein DnaA [Chloroflexi bacterium]|nr:chromosomal replication initiator protein DnaA [Chloroflexota bacterium]